MPTIIQTTQGTVTGLWGSAIVKGADGRAHPLKMGDIVRRGDVILTSQDGIVQLTSDIHAPAPSAAAATVDATTLPAAAEAPPKAAAARSEVDQVIEKLAQNDADAATAAGLAGGDGGEFLPGLRVDRITETLTPLGLVNGQEADTNNTPPLAEAAASAADLANIAPSALDGSVSGPENTTLPVALRGVDSDGNVVSVTVTGVPAGGTLLLADGITVVSAGQTLTPAQAAGLLFKPAVDFVGQATINFFVTDNQGSTSNSGTVSLNLVDTNPPPPTNQPPVAVNDSATTTEDTPATGNVLGNDSDADGNALTVTQFSLGGVNYAAGATAIVAGVGSLTLAANGAYTFTPEPNYHGAVPVATYTVSDGIASVTATLTLSVSAVNDAPVAQNDLASTPVNAPTTINVLANDSDVDGDALTVTSASVDPAFGTVTVNPNGTLAFNPANNVSGPVAIQYTVSDGQGGTASATVTVNIGPNTPPEGTHATVTITEDGSRSFSAADFGFSDANAGQVFANLRIDALPGAGSLTLSGVAVVVGQVIAVADLGNLVFTPAPNANGNGYASFSFSVQDSAGAFDTAPNQITIDVSPVNDPPVAVDDLASTPINTSTTIAVLGNDSDVDGNALTVTSASVDPARGTVTINPDGTLAFTPAGNITGPVLVSYIISDGQGGTASATVTVNVGPNTPPTGTDALVVIAEDGSRSFSVTDFGFSDADAGQGFANVRIDTLPLAGTLTLSGVAVAAGQVIPVAELGNLVYAPAPNANGSGSASFSFSVQDSGGAFDTLPNQITIDVTPVADPAVISGLSSGATVEDTTLTTGGTLTISDPDAGEAAFNPLTNVAGAHGTFSIDSSGAWTYTLDNADPAVQALGPGQSLPNETFTVTSIDGTSQVITVTITGTNDAPVAQSATVLVAEDDLALTGSVVATDVDANAVLTYALSGNAPAGLSFNADGSYRFDPSNSAYQSLGVGQSATLTIPYSVSDGLASSTANLVITITGTNDAPVAQAASFSVAEDSPLLYGSVIATDVDANAVLTFSLNAAPPPGLTFNPNGSYTFDASNPAYQALAAGQQQVLTIPYTVTDDQGATSIANLVITITGTNDAAVIGGIATGSVTEDGTPVASGTLTVSDVDSPAGFVASTATGTYGNFSVDAAGAWTYTLRNADANVQALTSAQHPIESFTVTAIDGTTSTVTVTVNGANEAPVAVATPAIGNEDAPGIPVLLGGTDVDGSIAAFTIGSLPTNGVLFFGGVPVTAGQTVPASAGAAMLSFVPAANFNGGTSFDFTTTDNEGAVSPSVQVPISVVAVADSAVIGGVSSGATVEDTTLTTGGTLTISDPDAGEAAFNPLTNVAGAHGTFSIDASGVWTYALSNADPAVQALGPGQSLPSETFTVTSIDGTSQVITVTITGTNDGPVALDDTASTPINTPLTHIDVLSNDSDIDGGTLSVTAASLLNPLLGSVTINPNGTLAFTPASNVSGPVVVNYTVSDGQGGFANATVTIDVGANTPPAGSDATVTVAEDGSRSFSAADFGYSDADAGQGFAQVRIDTLPAAGALTLNGVAVTVGQTIAVANLGNLVFTPAPNANGNAYAGFDFSVQDSAGAFDTTPNRLSIAVSAVNDAPVATGTATLTAINEDDLNPPGASVGSLFATRFSDATDQVSGGSSANTLAGIAISNHSVDASKGAWQYSTDGGASWSALPAGSTASAVTLAGSDWLRFVPAANYNGAATPLAAHLIESGGAAIVSGATVDLGTGTGGTTVYSAATVPVVAAINPVNDPPVARNDEGSVTAAQTLTVSTAEGVILSTSTPSGRDTDIEGDALAVAKVSAGTGAPSTTVTTGGVTIAGTYGDLLLRSDGSYTYTASRADTVATGTRVDDVFTYQVSDGNGGLANASLTVHVGGAADTLTAAPPTTTALTATLGLNGEYYGYNDFNPGPTSPNRRHADDGVYGNLDRAADVTSIVNGRNAAFGGVAVAGSSTAADANAADARFIARSIDYGTSPTVTGTLGTNPNIAAGGSTAGLTDNNSQLFKFLNRSGGGDAGTIAVRQGTGDNDQIGGGPTSGLGRTSDVAMRLTGQAYLAAGLYDIRVYADDGFRLRLDNQTVAAFDDIQSPTTRVYTGVPIDGGLTPLELLYWEQGGNAVLRVEFKLSGTPDSAYQVLGSQNLPLFSDANAPVLSDLQDLVAGPTPGSYLVRTGSLLDGGNGDDTLTGSAGRDILIGGQGKDTLNGGAGDDLIRGGAGHDQLTGGAGHDVFRWSLGDAGTAGTPARDVITDFDNTPHGGDVLDLRDLLVGESHAANTVALPASIGLNNALTITPHEGNLANYLHFSTVGGNTVVEISSTGGFASSYTPAAVDQVITLTGLNLVGSFTNDHQVINDLLQRGKLVTD